MKKRMFAFSLVLVFALVVAVAGCGGGDELKGKWVGSGDDFDVTWDFDGKGGCSMESAYGKQEGTYTIDGEKVMIELEYWDAAIAYFFTIDGSKLALKAEEDFRPSYELEKK